MVTGSAPTVARYSLSHRRESCHAGQLRHSGALRSRASRAWAAERQVERRIMVWRKASTYRQGWVGWGPVVSLCRASAGPNMMRGQSRAWQSRCWPAAAHHRLPRLRMHCHASCFGPVPLAPGPLPRSPTHVRLLARHALKAAACDAPHRARRVAERGKGARALQEEVELAHDPAGTILEEPAGLGARGGWVAGLAGCPALEPLTVLQPPFTAGAVRCGEPSRVGSGGVVFGCSAWPWAPPTIRVVGWLVGWLTQP